MAPRPGGVPPPPTPPSKTHLHLHHPPPRHKRVNHPNRIVTAHNFVQNLRKKRRLVSRLSRHVRHHRLESNDPKHHNSPGFHTAWKAMTHTAESIDRGLQKYRPASLHQSTSRG